MEISNYNILANFHTFNRKYFGGILPIPKLIIRHSYKTLGYFHYNIDEHGNIFNETIEISDNYDYTPLQFRDILVHEMIHYYLLYKGIDKICHHGKEFKKMSEEFNHMYGMNITSTIDISGYKVKKGKSNFMSRLCALF
jgi:predicted SprT family Zn-dependent metalloprotease